MLSQFTMPTVVVHGRYDQTRPLAHAEWLVEHLPHAELFLVDAGHAPMVEARSEVERAVNTLTRW